MWQFGDMRGQLRMKIGVTPPSEGVGTANTAVVFHAKKLLALHEGDLPYAVRSPAPSLGFCKLLLVAYDV